MKLNPKYIDVTVGSTTINSKYSITAYKNHRLSGDCRWGKINWSADQRFKNGHLVLFSTSGASLVWHDVTTVANVHIAHYFVPTKSVLVLDNDTWLKPTRF